MLDTDEGKLGQILRNLVSNALKFTERGEVRVSARPSSDGAAVAIEVADTGIGIAPEDHERIFHEFGQVDSHVQRRVKGTGLGLALSRRLAELLGGSLSVRSAPGSGSVFTLVLPRVYVRPAERRMAEAPARRRRRRRRRGRGARARSIIDDEETARYALASRLAAIPFDVIEAADPREGLRLAHESPPDAIFLDLIMPEMLGFDVLERLREDPATRRCRWWWSRRRCSRPKRRAGWRPAAPPSSPRRSAHAATPPPASGTRSRARAGRRRPSARSTSAP